MNDAMPVAFVNEQPIFLKEYQRHLKEKMLILRKDKKGSKISDPEFETIQCEVINQLIDWKLVVEYGKQLQLVPSQTEVEDKYQSLCNSFPDPEEFDQAMSSWNCDPVEILSDISDQIIYDRVIEKEISPKLQIDEAQLLDFYEANKRYLQLAVYQISHIFLRIEDQFPEQMHQQIRDRMSQAYEKIKSGATFEDMVLKISECPSREQAGNLGVLNQEEINYLFGNQIKDFSPGIYPEILETEYGVHILRIGDKKDGKPISPYEELKTELKEQLSELIYQEEFDKLLDTLRNNIPIAFGNVKDAFLQSMDL